MKNLTFILFVAACQEKAICDRALCAKECVKNADCASGVCTSDFTCGTNAAAPSARIDSVRGTIDDGAGGYYVRDRLVISGQGFDGDLVVQLLASASEQTLDMTVVDAQADTLTVLLPQAVVADSNYILRVSSSITGSVTREVDVLRGEPGQAGAPGTLPSSMCGANQAAVGIQDGALVCATVAGGAAAPLHLSGADDATTITDSGLLTLSDGNLSIGLDARGLQARNADENASTLQLNASGGSVSIGASSNAHLAMSVDAIQALSSNVTSDVAPLDINATGGDIALGGVGSRVRIHSISSVSNSADSGALSIGSAASVQVGIDNNEIQARSAGTGSVLYLNAHGGNVAIGKANQSNVTIYGTTKLKPALYQTATVPSSGGNTTYADCDAGDIAIGGGCGCVGFSLVAAARSTIYSTRWVCECTGHSSDTWANALCLQTP